MKIRVFSVGVVASLALSAPAFAFDRSGTSNFNSRFGAGTSTFQQSYDPDDGTFSRTGKIAMEDGRTIAYSLSGKCTTAKSDCDLRGTATGPFGGKWRVTGTLKRETDGSHLIGTLTRPDGETVDFDRHIQGGGPLLQNLDK